MKKKKKLILSIIIGIIVLIGAAVAILLITNNSKYKLTSEERNWINQNINNVQNVYVSKDENIFSNNGHGVYYDFLEDFSEEYDLKMNPIIMENSEEYNGIKLNVTTNYNDDEFVLFKDHYVVLSKEWKSINSIDDLNNVKIGVLINDLDYIKKYLPNVNVEFIHYDTKDALYEALGSEVTYLIVPRINNINNILSDNIKIVYHLSDINNYYTYKGNDEILSSIMLKYLKLWSEEKFNISYNENSLDVYASSLKIDDTDLDKLLSVDYDYGFVNASPYEAIMSGNYGGIVASYLQGFSDLTNVKFNISKYKDYDKLSNELNKGKVDIYFDYNTNIENDYSKTNYGIPVSLSIISNNNSGMSFNSIYGLINKDVYVLKDSQLHSYLNKIGNINIHTYSNIQELFTYNKENKIIIIDTYQFNYYKDNKLNNYVSTYNTFIDSSYKFNINKEHNILYRLLDAYIAINDNHVMINNGITNHQEVINHGTILNNIAKYIILSILVVLIVVYATFKNSKKVRISKKVRKDEKIRFIDQLTSLKNRTYLSGFIKDWNANTIYPQTIIVLDLNQIQEINDKYGYDEGDKQIQACANALIKTQLENSEIMRSDGNEFVIYLVGYNQKQVTNYIHKLNRELKKMPYPYGAEFGYSFIENDLKSIEDAMNEAVEDMKKSKESGKNGK